MRGLKCRSLKIMSLPSPLPSLSLASEVQWMIFKMGAMTERDCHVRSRNSYINCTLCYGVSLQKFMF